MENLSAIKKEAMEKIAACKDNGVLNQLRVLYLGKKGPIQEVMKTMKDLSKEERPAFGAKINEIKQELSALIEERKTVLEEKETAQRMKQEKLDITLSGYTPNVGNLHPLMIVQQELEDLFVGLGYSVAEGPEVECDLYNFERANIPKDHPARDMQDTFFINAEELLRTHTTAVQMRQLEKCHAEGKELIKVICPNLCSVRAWSSVRISGCLI